MFENIDTTKLTEREIDRIMSEKGYKKSTFKEFQKDEYKNMYDNSINQVSACMHNLKVFLKDSAGKGKYYIIRLTKGLEVRTWHTIQ